MAISVQRNLQVDWAGPRLTDIDSIDMPNNKKGPITVEVFDRERVRHLLRYPAAEAHHAISALLAGSATSGMFEISPHVAARTEWVVSFPTRRAHDNAIVGPLPFELPFTGRCDDVQLALRDTSGAAFPPDLDMPPTVPLCSAVDVLRFESTGLDTGPIFATDGDPLRFDDAGGRATLDFAIRTQGVRHSTPDLDGRCWSGLPAWTLSVSAYENHNARPGLMANYSATNSTTRGGIDVVDCSTLD